MFIVPPVVNRQGSCDKTLNLLSSDNSLSFLNRLKFKRIRKHLNYYIITKLLV